jgi:hypothetical protein
MKEYKLINRKTGEETICTRVAIDRFDYYILGLPKYDEWVLELDTFNIGRVTYLNEGLCRTIQFEKLIYKCRQVIATNNPSIDIPRVIDETFTKSFEYFVSRDKCDSDSMIHFSKGYNTHAETHTLNDDEVIEFSDYVGFYYANVHNPVVPTKELLQLFKEQLTKTIYYE